MTEQQHDVVINGGGPVGMGLAIDLGQRGRRVAVVERHARPQPVPKGQNLTQRTMEHFLAWGCEPELRAARVVPRDFGIGGLTAYGTLLSGWHYDWLQREQVRKFYAADNERLPQYATEAVLRTRAAQLPSVEVIYGWGGRELAQDAQGARLTIEPVSGDAPERVLQARFLVGCDGSRSVVREGAGITETRRDHAMKMVLLVFRSRELHGLLERFPDKQFFNVLHPALKGYWQFFGRVDLGETWFFHAPVPMDATADNIDFAAYLHSAVGTKFAVTFDYIGFWDLRIAIADRYRNGNVFVAGDAAHSHPPYGGYGINTGFEDARNLGWKLDAALGGWAGPGLLDSYDAERRPVFASTARDFIENFIEADRLFLEQHDPARDRAEFETAWAARAAGTHAVTAFDPNYRGSPIVVGGPDGQPSAIGGHTSEARPGHHLPPCGLSDGRNVYGALGGGFTLIALDATEVELATFAEAARTARIPLVVIRDDRRDDRGGWQARLILVRPDQFVAWCGNDAGDPAAILARATGA
jgi:2-polyprenyl-6-methoxyphenol hydroxylase-like FAD-dependent oxidoreductase